MAIWDNVHELGAGGHGGLGGRMLPPGHPAGVFFRPAGARNDRRRVGIASSETMPSIRLRIKGQHPGQVVAQFSPPGLRFNQLGLRPQPAQ